MASHDRQDIVIVGSGFAGFYCGQRLGKAAQRSGGRVRVRLVSPLNYLLYTPLLPEVAGGLMDPRFVAVPLAESLAGVELVLGAVEDVDLQAQSLRYRSPDGQTDTLAWDRCVLTPGSVTQEMDIPGLADHAYGLKSTAEALYLREQLITQLELADQEDDPELARQRRTIVVVGASYAGVELVSQLRALADEIARHRGFDPQAVRFLLLDVADKVMPEVGDTLGKRVLDVLRGSGIDVRLETSLKSVADDHVVLTDDQRVATQTVAWVTGVAASPLIARLGLPTEKGRLTVRADLSVPDHPRVFAGGDAAAVPDLTQPGSITPPTAQHAVRQGKALARNVLASVGIGTARPYKHRNMGLVVDLGPGFAVANPLGLKLSGMPAKAVARGYHLIALPRGVNRWAASLAYLTDTVAPRSLASFGLVTHAEARLSGRQGADAD